MNKYELMYIIDVSLEDEPRKELIERVSTLITGNGGEVEKIDEWGKRRLAYAIDYKNEGYYVLVNFTAGPALPREIERVLQINENVLRYLIVRLEEKHTSVKPRQTPLRPQYGRSYEQPDTSAEAIESVPAQAVEAPAQPAEAAQPPQETPEAGLPQTVQVEAGVDTQTASDVAQAIEETLEAES